MNCKTLDKVSLNTEVRIEDIQCSDALKSRIFDMGIIKDEIITPIFKSPFGDPTAFLIKDTIIALRNADCKHIYVNLI